MKIRHKQSGVELEGEFTASLGYYPTEPVERYWASNDNSRYNHNEWEAVKPPPKSTFKSRYDGAFWQDIVTDLSDRLDRLEARQS